MRLPSPPTQMGCPHSSEPDQIDFTVDQLSNHKHLFYMSRPWAGLVHCQHWNGMEAAYPMHHCQKYEKSSIWHSICTRQAIICHHTNVISWLTKTIFFKQQNYSNSTYNDLYIVGRLCEHHTPIHHNSICCGQNILHSITVLQCRKDHNLPVHYSYIWSTPMLQGANDASIVRKLIIAQLAQWRIRVLLPSRCHTRSCFIHTTTIITCTSQ